MSLTSPYAKSISRPLRLPVLVADPIVFDTSLQYLDIVDSPSSSTYDISGNQRLQTITGATSRGNYLTFDGTNDKREITAFDPYGNSRKTITVFVLIEGVSAGINHMLLGHDKNFWLSINNTPRLRFDIRDAANNETDKTSTNVLPASGWYTVAFTANTVGLDFKLYINAVEETLLAGSNNAFVDSAAFDYQAAISIYHFYDVRLERYTTGNYAMSAIYDRVLSIKELTELHEFAISLVQDL